MKGKILAGIFVLILISAFTSAQVYSSATYVTRSSHQPSFQTYYGAQANTYWPILNEKEQCKGREDFILKVAPASCQPAVVRSDLLAEQNVPVFCQIDALKINPLLDVKEIRNIGFGNEHPKGVVAVGFHPARAALRTRDRLLGDPLINNIGYAVIVLQKHPDERTLPDFVEVNLSAQLEYDAGNVLGIGRAEFILEEQADHVWSDASNRQSFWNGKYFVRLLRADDQGADIAIYSGDRQIATTYVEKGKRSRELFIPESYCRAALYLDYTGFEAAKTRARIALGSANSTDIIDVYEGSRFLNGRCAVSQIRLDNFTTGTGNVSVRCGSETILLQLRSKSSAAFDVFIQNDGSKVFPVREGTEYIIELDKKNYKLSGEDTLYVLEKGEWKKSKLSGNEKRIKEALEAYRQLDRAGSVSPDSLVIERSWAGVAGVEGNFSAALQAFEELVRMYPFEKHTVQGVPYGQEGLEKAIALATLLGKEAQRLRLLQLYVDTYPNAPQTIAYNSELSRAAYIDFTNSAAALEVDQKFRTIRLVELKEPIRRSSATFAIGSASRTLEAGASYTFPTSVDKASTFTVQRIENDYVTVSTTCPQKSLLNFRGTMRIGESMVVCNQPVVLQKMDVERSARVVLTPQAWGTETKTNLTIRIGIEKRAIQLAPNATLSRISELNQTIKKWEQISTNLGNVVTGLKGACFATVGVLTAKNFVTGLSGTGYARQQVMRGEKGWTSRCQAEVSRGESNSLDACFSKHAPTINKDVAIADAQIQKVNAAIKEVESGVPKTEGVFSNSIDPSQAVPKYRDYLLKNHGNDNVQIKDSKGVRNVSVSKLLENEKGYENGEYSYDSLRDLHKNLLLKQSTDLSEGSKANAQTRLETIGSTISVNHELAERHKKEQGLRDLGFAAPFMATPEGQGDRYVEVVPAGNLKQSGQQIFADPDITQSATVVVPLRENPHTGVEHAGGTYILGLQEAGNGAHTVKQVLRKEGEGGSARYVPYNDDMIQKIDSASFVSTYGIGTLYSQQQLSYFNKYENPEVRFFDREPYKGMPAIVPLDLQRGWYVATKQTLPAFGGIGAFDASGRPTSFWLCNVGPNHREQFNEGLGDDICEMVNFQTGQPLNKFPGLSDEEARALVARAQRALEEAARQHGNSRVTISGVGDMKVGKPAISAPSVQCQDFMSPGECNLIFNLCDPVICPPTRCDFGGAYPVADVVQTGIIGSTLLCLPNFPEVKVPVCLTGIHAGIDGYVSILKAHRDCLQESVSSGKMIGICDQIYSIYTCEFFWRQLAPLAKVLVPRLLETAFGQNVRGGGEYLTVMGAWSNMQQSVGYFTQVYGVNSFKAFQARSTEEVGGEFCKSFISTRAPTSLKTVLAPDSPPQYHAYFSAIKHSDVTVPATSQYKVFYHIYAGKDQGAYYRVYLKNPPQSSYYAASPIVQIASGFIKKGTYKDETIDRTAPEGYQELCVNLNGEETCGFKQVSTSFAVNYVRDAIVADQIKESTITSEKECISGSASPTALLNPNLQQAAQEAVSPEIYRRGVIRICATQNPGTGTDPTRFVPVGRCDSEKVQCWLDKQSVDNAITDNNRGIRNTTLRELEGVQREHLEKGGVLFDDKGANAELNSLQGMVTYLEQSYGARSKGGITSGEVVQAQAVLGRAQAVRDRLFLNHHKAHLLILEGRVYAATAAQLAEDRLLQTGRGTAGSTESVVPENIRTPPVATLSTLLEDGTSARMYFQYHVTNGWQWSLNEADNWMSFKEERLNEKYPQLQEYDVLATMDEVTGRAYLQQHISVESLQETQPSSVQVPELLTLPFTIDLNPGGFLQNVPLIDQTLVVQYDEYAKSWKRMGKSVRFSEEYASELLNRLHSQNFADGLSFLVARVQTISGAALQTPRVIYRSKDNNDFIVYSSLDQSDQQVFAFREGVWMYHNAQQRKFIATGAPENSELFASIFADLRGFDYVSGMIYLFNLNEASSSSIPDIYSLKPGKTPTGADALVVYAGATPLDIYVVGDTFFMRVTSSTQLQRVGKRNDYGKIDIESSVVSTSPAPSPLKNHVLSLQGKSYNELNSGSIRVDSALRSSAGTSENVIE